MRGIIAAMLLAPLLAPGAATAQEAVRYFAAPGYSGEGMPYRDCTLATDGEASADEAVDETLSEAPATRESVTLPSGLSPEEAEAIRAERSVVLNQQLTQFDGLLSTMPADYPNRAEIMFRKAETLRELADANYLAERAIFNECMNNWYACVSDSECYEPMPNYDGAIEAYSEIARNHPSYQRLDEVVFRLGETLMENDRAAEGIQYLTRLVNTYPDSGYIPDARLLMAEHYFENDLLIVARQNYDEVLNFPQSSLYNYAIYKLGWVDLNEDLYDDALTRFQTVVTNLENNPEDSLDFRNQALNDMIRAYAEIDDGWRLAQTYYENLEGEDFMRRKLSQLASLYDEQGKDDSRVAVLDYFVTRYPYDTRIPQWAEEMLDSLQKIGQWDRYEEKAREFIAVLDANSPWGLQNSGDQRIIAGARVSAETWLLNIITRNDQEARRLSDPVVKQGLFREVRADYQQFFSQFGDSEAAYDQAFFFAESLYYQMANEGECNDPEFWFPAEECDQYLKESGDQYRAVVELQPDPAAAHAHDAAIGALQVYDQYMRRSNPRVDESLPAPGEYDQFFGERLELNEEAADYVEIVAWFAELYPDDEQIPAASWRAASLYLYAAQIEEAAQRFETIIEHHPRHQFAQNAALAAFVCYNYVENWVKIESVARRLLSECEGDTRICDAASLQSAIAYAMNNQAEDLITEGDRLKALGEDREALVQYVAAADKRVALYREFPESQWAANALYNAAVTYELARRIDDSIGLFNEFLAAFPESELVPEGLFTLALIYESQARFQEACETFDRLDAHPTFEDFNAAVLNNGRLREATSQFDEAIQRYQQYITLDPDSDVSKELFFRMAQIERDRGNLDAAFAQYQAFYDRFTGDAVRRLAAVFFQAEIRREQERTNDALALFRQVYSMYGVGVMGFDEANLPTGWTTPPGGNFASEDQRNSVLPFVAEAVFTTSDLLYETARTSDLTYDTATRRGTETLSAKLVARGEAIVAGQRAMYEVLNLGDAEWAVAAATRIGQLYKDFYRDLYNVPAPDIDQCFDMGGTPDQCDELQMQFDDLLYEYGAALEEKAMTAWAEGRRIAEENNVYTTWLQTMITEMNDTDRSYRIGGAEGLEPVSTSDAFLSTRYILDLSEKLLDFENFTLPTAVPDAAAPSLVPPTGEGAPVVPAEAAPAVEPVTP